MDSGTNSTDCVQEPVAESPAAATSPSFPAAATTKGHGLRRWRRIPREPAKEDSPATPAAAGGDAGGAGEDPAQLHKRRLPLAADASKGKQDGAAEVESLAASVESRFVGYVPPGASPAPAKLDPDIGLLIASAGFSVGADSNNNEDWSSKSTAASAPRALPRHELLHTGFGRERDRARSRAPGASPHGKNPRAARGRGDRLRAATVATSAAEAENSRSSVESDLRSSSAAHTRQSGAGVTGNGIHKTLFIDEEHSDEGQPSEEVRSTAGCYYKENGSVVRRLVQGDGDFDADDDTLDDTSVAKDHNGGMDSGVDSYAKTISLLQTAQQALENEIQQFVEIGKETYEDFTIHYNDTEWSSSPHLKEAAELSEKIRHLESKLEEASALVEEKGSILLEANTLNRTQPGGTAAWSNNLLTLHSDLDQLLKEKMEAEIQCLILTRASQTWKTEYQIARSKVEKSQPKDHKQLELKLQHAENRAVMLEEIVDKLEAQCKQLSGTSEVLKLQTRASRVSVFCFIQLVLLCIAVGMVLVQFLPSSNEVVPT